MAFIVKQSGDNRQGVTKSLFEQKINWGKMILG